MTGPVVSIAGYDLGPAALETLKVQSDSVERFELELNDLLTAAMAAATRCERSLAKLGRVRRVSHEATSQRATDLAGIAERERARAASLVDELQAARRDLDQVRAESRAEREIAKSAVEREARARGELAATQARNQEIADAQLLRIVELTRELQRSRAAARADRETTPNHGLRAAPAPRQTVPGRNHLAPEFAAIEAVLAGSPPVAVQWQEIA